MSYQSHVANSLQHCRLSYLQLQNQEQLINAISFKKEGKQIPSTKFEQRIQYKEDYQLLILKKMEFDENLGKNKDTPICLFFATAFCNNLY